MDNNTPPEAVTGAVLTFSTGTGGRMTSFYNASLSGVFQAPYYDNDFNYQIDSITWTGGINTPSGSLNLLEISITNGNITFSGAGIDTTAPIVTFSSRYITRSKKVIFDRRTGRVEVNKE